MTVNEAGPAPALEEGRVCTGRVLTFLTIKRINPRFRKTYGHWWVEVDGVESYGWWPARVPVGLRGLLIGLQGTLNGLGATNGGSRTVDPYHGDEADHAFHPTLLADKTDEQVRQEIREFSWAYSNIWQWQWWWQDRPTRNCRTFQEDLFAAVGLVEGDDNLHTRGPGCPFMYQLRRTGWAISDARDWLRTNRAALGLPPGQHGPAPMLTHHQEGPPP